MSKIFISHSSKDDDIIRYFTKWIDDQGYDYWIDNDPHRGIRAGERWIEALRRATNMCEAVIFLVSKNWLASEWCHMEVEKAQSYGRLCIGVVLDDTEPQDEALSPYSDWQFCKIGGANALGGKDYQEIELDGGLRHCFLKDGLTRLTIALEEADLSPTTLQWQYQSDDQIPYRGLDPFTEQDGALFFGRDADIHKRIHEIRELRERQKNQIIFINAPSGAGKSSFLRAGLIPRLKRDRQHFYILPTLRRRTGLMDLENKESLLSVINIAYKDFGTFPGIYEIKQTLNDGSKGLLKLIADLKQKYQDKYLKPFSINTLPTVILPIDQAEELLPHEADIEQLLIQLNTLIQHENIQLQIIIVFTLRSDTWEQMRDIDLVSQNQTIQTIFDLSPISNTNYRDIITKPLDVWQKTLPEITKPQAFSDELIEQLIKDNTGNDALPVLSFTLRDLVNHYKDKQEINIDDYDQQGGSQGIIKNIINNALKQAGFDIESKTFNTLLSHLFIPHLIKLDTIDSHASRKITPRIKLYEINADNKDIDRLIKTLVDSRILSGDDQNLEIAHEAVFRKWPFMVNQIEDQRHNLSNFSRIERNARDFAKEKNEKLKPDKLVDQDSLLNLADQLLKQPAFQGKSKEPLISEYIQACHLKENKAESKKKQNKRNLKVLSVIAVIAAIFAVIFAIISKSNQFKAEKNLYQAVKNESLALSALAESIIDPNDYKLASKMLLAAWPRDNNDQIRPQKSKIMESAHKIFQLKNRRIDDPMEHVDPNNTLSIEWDIYGAQWNQSETKVLSWSQDGSIIVWDAATQKQIGDLMKHTGIRNAKWNQAGTKILSWSEDGNIKLWDVESQRQIGKTIKLLFLKEAQWNQAGTKILTFSNYSDYRIWDATTQNQIGDVMEHDTVGGAQWNLDGTKILSWSYSGRSIKLWDAETQSQIGKTMEYWSVSGAKWNQTEAKILSWSGLEGIRLWDAITQSQIGNPMEHLYVEDTNWNQTETKILSWSKDGNIKLWDAETQSQIGNLMVHNESIGGAQWNSTGTKILSWSKEGTIKVWNAETQHQIGNSIVHAESISDAQWNQAGTRILSWSWSDDRIKLWDAETQSQIGNPMEHLSAIDAKWNRAGTQILSWSNDGIIKLWSVATSPLIGNSMEHLSVDGAQWNQPSTQILSWSQSDGTIKLWNPETQSQIGNPMVHGGSMDGAQWNQANTQILSWSQSDGTIKLWNPETQIEIGNPMVHGGSMDGAQWNMAGTQILSWSQSDGTIKLWNPKTQSEIGNPMMHGDSMDGVRWNQVGTRILSWSENDGAIKLWNPETQTEIGNTMVHGDTMDGAQWNQAGTKILSWSRDIINIWDVESQIQVGNPIRDYGEFRNVGWNQAGTIIMGRTLNYGMRLWDAITINEIGIIPSDFSVGAQWNQVGTKILSWPSQEVDSINHWDVATQTPIGTPMEHDGVQGAQFNQAGTKILSWSNNDGTIKMWDANYYGKKWSLQELCDRLAGDYDLKEIEMRFDIIVNGDICNTPVPYDYSKLE